MFDNFYNKNKVIDNNLEGFVSIDGDWNFVNSILYMWDYALWNVNEQNTIEDYSYINHVIRVHFSLKDSVGSNSLYTFKTYSENGSLPDIQTLTINQIDLTNIVFGSLYLVNYGETQTLILVEDYYFQFMKEIKTPVSIWSEKDPISQTYQLYNYVLSPKKLISNPEEIGK